MSMSILIKYIQKNNINKVIKLIISNPKLINEFDDIYDCNALIASVKYYNIFEKNIDIFKYLLLKTNSNIYQMNNNNKDVFKIAHSLKLYDVLELLYNYTEQYNKLKKIKKIKNSRYVNINEYNSLLY